MKKGFTLIELLIVVAIIAILAAIAVPNFLEAQVRAKVSRARNDMRSLATALETYYVDNNSYPMAILGTSGNVLRNRLAGNALALPTGTVAAGPADASNQNRPTFAVPGVTGTAPNQIVAFSSLTTPIAYITSYFNDPFSNGARYPFSYLADGPGWLLASYGPQANQPANPTAVTQYSSLIFQMGTQFTTPAETPFSGRDIPGSRNRLETGVATGGIPTGLALTYDPTNGTTSPGGLWRIKE